MYRNKRILGLIPARGGSIGIPDKNVTPLAGKPLVTWTIEAAAHSRYLDAIYCSTNDDKVARVAEETGLAKVLRRPDELCTATAKTIDAVVHAVETLAARGETFDYVMLLQPTSPLRQTRHIDGIIEYVVKHDLPACVSVHQIHELPVLMRYIESNPDGTTQVHSILAQNSTVRRQDAAKGYYVDGMLYLHRVSELSRETSLNDAPYGYLIDAEYAHDVHTITDISECAAWLSGHRDDA